MFRALATPAALLLLALPVAAAERLLGEWTINHALTDELRPEFDKMGSGLPGRFSRPQISVGGLPIPLPGGSESAPRRSGAAPKDPGVLQCHDLSIEAVGKELLLTYREIGSERMRKGKWRGRATSWSKGRLLQTYSTTERSVRKVMELRPDGRLLVTVVINPKGDSKRTYRRVFERPGTTPPAAAPATPTDEA